jgi:hypothetical protein
VRSKRGAVRAVWIGVAFALLAVAACARRSAPDTATGAEPTPAVNDGSGGQEASPLGGGLAGRTSEHANEPPLVDAGERSGADAGYRSDAGPRDGGDGVREGDAAVPACAASNANHADDPRPLPVAGPPEALGVLVGPSAVHPPGDLALYGTDLGFSFEHRGELMLMFGDTLADAYDVCRGEDNDDTIATLPLAFDGTVPKPEFRARPDAPQQFLAVSLMRGTTSLPLGFAQAPLTAFSDGERAFALFDRLELPRCDAGGACGSSADLSCSTRIGECQPALNTVVPPLCDLDTKLGCFYGQECVPAGAAVCVDVDSSQYDGSADGEIAASAGIAEWGVQREDEREVFDSVFSFRTNKFISATARTIEHLDADKDCNDYSPGHHDLLIWGRPRYSSQGEREAQLYLMTHALPLTFDDDGQLRFAPRFFAGVDPDTNEARWSTDQSDAKPLAMDGIVDGDPHEPLHVVDHTAISWLGAPIDKWVMLYGGGLSSLLVSSEDTSDAPAPGAIVMRFADHPWGPWSPPAPHLRPGSPGTIGDPNGPAGFLYNPECVSTQSSACALPDALRADPSRIAEVCDGSASLWDAGQLYGVNIIDPYTTPNAAGGFDMIWNVSTWNPYAVVLMKSAINPPVSVAPAH